MPARRPDSTRWIQRAIEHPGSLHRQLHIRPGDPIPMTLLLEVMRTPVGGDVYWAGQGGSGHTTYVIPVTHLLKQRANLALNLRKMNE